MKRYRLWYTTDGEMIEDPHGEYVEYECLLDIAERLEKLAFNDATPTAITIALNAIINEIRGKQ